MPIFRFTIEKPVPASVSNVVANYLDLDHVPSHSALSDCQVVSESDRVACFLLTSKIGPFRFRNAHYFEYRPPNQILQVVKTILGPMIVLATARPHAETNSDTLCLVEVNIELHLPGWAYPFRNLIRWLLMRADHVVLEEDNRILKRRQRLFGDNIDDYLHPENRMLFKDAFRKAFQRPR